MARFSIIVPVFNAEEYLDDCLDSACGQTLDDLEIICVNDGSTDGSHDILSARSLGDERIRVIEKANGGPSSARNDGIRLAQGDYVCFLDADDTLEPFALERIARAFDEKVGESCDAVVFGWSYEPPAKADRFVKEHARVRDAYYPGFDPKLIFEEMSNPYLRLAIRREALEQSGVLFDEDLRVGEDAQFLFALYPRIGGVKLISDKLYRYQLPHEGSVMAEYASDVAHLCVGDLNAAISIFADWKAAGFADLYGAQLIKWFVRTQLYTILRQPAEVREPLTALVRHMWRANFASRDLVAMGLDEPTARLVRIVLGANDDGELLISEEELSRDLLKWRLAEYGIADLAMTAASRALSFLLDNRSMLLKGGQAQAPAEGPAAADAAQPAADVAASADQEPDAPAQVADGAQAQAGPAADEEPLVSVIAPIYNVEAFLDQALDSIEAQSLRSIEVLCIDDGSTDSSAQIADAHAKRDARVRVIHKPNGGYGSACNCGIREARGTWLAIVEPDDWIEPDMYRAMTDFAAGFDSEVDVVKTPYWRIWMPDTPQQRRVNCSYRGRIKPASQPFALTDPGVTHLIIHHPSIWSALYRRSFIERCGISFMEIPGAGWADNPFLAETLCQAQSIVYLDEPFYNYREETPEKTESVARNNWRVSLERWHDMMDVYERLGVTDAAIRRAHISRGFTYAGLVVQYHDLDAEDDVRQMVTSVFQRMDDDLVFSDPTISPGSKELYAKLKGVDLPQVSGMPYLAHVVSNGLYNVVNTGPAMTLDTMKSFMGAHAKREGK